MVPASAAASAGVVAGLAAVPEAVAVVAVVLVLAAELEDAAAQVEVPNHNLAVRK
jgi:hypothetical protein